MRIPNIDFMRDMILKVIDVTSSGEVVVSKFDGVGTNSGLFIKYEEGGQISFERDGEIVKCVQPILEKLVTAGEFIISYPKNDQETCPLYEVAKNYFLKKDTLESFDSSEEEGSAVVKVLQTGLNSTYNYFATNESSTPYDSRDEENNLSWQDTLKHYAEQYWPYALGITAGVVIAYTIKWFKGPNDQADSNISLPLGTMTPKPVSCVEIQGKYIEVTNSHLKEKILCLIQTDGNTTKYYELLNKGNEIQCLEKDKHIISTLGLNEADNRKYFKDGYHVKACLGIIKDGKEEYINLIPKNDKKTALCVKVLVDKQEVLAPTIVMLKFDSEGKTSYMSPQEYQDMFTKPKDLSALENSSPPDDQDALAALLGDNEGES